MSQTDDRAWDDIPMHSKEQLECIIESELRQHKFELEHIIRNSD